MISIRITSLYGFQPSSVVLACKTAPIGQELQVSIGPSPHQWFVHANRDFWNRITSLYVSQTSPDVLCMQNSVISIRKTGLYGSQPSCVVFACKTDTFRPELHVSIGLKPHLRFCACKTACLASELLVSMGPSLDLWFLDAKQRLLDPNNKSLGVPDITCHNLCMQSSVINTRITSLYRSQPSSAVLSIHNSVFRTKITCLYGAQTSPVILCM